MEGIQNPDNHMTSAVTFVEGGIRDACDYACSICLEEFSKRSDNGTKLKFNTSNFFFRCQRSSQCPMCWQAISLKDPTIQELLQVVERERRFRVTLSRNTTIFHHPTLDDFELQHHIIRHLVAAAVGRAHYTSRRDGKRRPSAHSHPRFLVFSAYPGSQQSGSGSSSLTPIAGETEAAATTVASPSTPPSSRGDELSQRISPLPSSQNTSASGPTVIPVNRGGFSFNNRSAS
ncbi:hypothetical protein PVK06_011602 [Gossypium arboreum]|uniref:RING-type domain-containing protein n=1 Tax=Gossypium arboreum TaxID=29729 RepID=A0ABR0Q9D9_GOSAR|nr:hypothetical protein PVK06_011602 [Gossypium arboreum]